MSSPTSRHSYLDCYKLWDRANDTPNGIRFRVPNHNEALKLRMRLHMSRQIDRKGNTEIYIPGDPMYGQSIYDPYQVLIRCDSDNAWWVYIEPRTPSIIGHIEELQTYEEDTKWLEPSEPQKLISHSGTEPSEKKSESVSKPTNEFSSSMPSTKPESDQEIQILRRL